MDQIDRWQSRIFAGTWLAYAGFYLCRKNFSVLMPLLPFSKNELAQVVFLFSIAYATGQFLSGALSDRFRARTVVALGMFASALCSAALAGAHAIWWIAALQAINGLAQSTGWPGLCKLTGAWFPPLRRGVLMAWWCTNYVTGGFLATLLATFLATGPLSSRFGWRIGAAGPALLLAIIACVFLLLVRDREVSRAGAASPGRVWREVLSSPSLWSIAICYFCLKLMRYTFLFWLPLYLVERLHYGVSRAGYLSSAYELVGFVGVPLAGYLSDRVLRGRRFPVGAGMLFALAVVCVLFPLSGNLGTAGTFIAIGLAGILTFGPDTLMGGAATQDAVTPAATATAAGFVNGVGSAGQLISPILVAAVVPWTGWDGLFSIFAVSSILGGASLALHWNRRGYSLEAKQANA